MAPDIKQMISYYVANKYELVTASKDNCLEIGRSLMNSGANVNRKYFDGNTALIEAAENKRTHIVKALIAAQANINIKNKTGNTALHYSAKNGSLTIVEALIAARANINVKNKCGWTPLHYSSTYGYLNTASALISAGADLNIKKNDGETVLHYSTRNGHLDIVKALIVAGANIKIKDKNGSTALHLASERSLLNIIKALIAAGADINEKNGSGSTPLHLALECACFDIVEDLVTAGADIFLENGEGKTSLQLAHESSPSHICDFMIRYTALMNYGKGNKDRFTRKMLIFSQFMYWNDCEEQIEKMKDIQLGNSSVSIFEFLSETDENKVAFYSSEENFGIRNELQRAQYRDKLWRYTDIFETQFKKGHERSLLLLKSQELMTICFPITLPLEIRRMISEYLSNQDLENFQHSIKFRRNVKSTSQKTKTMKRKLKTIC